MKWMKKACTDTDSDFGGVIAMSCDEAGQQRWWGPREKWLAVFESEKQWETWGKTHGFVPCSEAEAAQLIPYYSKECGASSQEEQGMKWYRLADKSRCGLPAALRTTEGIDGRILQSWQHVDGHGFMREVPTRIHDALSGYVECTEHEALLEITRRRAAIDNIDVILARMASLAQQLEAETQKAVEWYQDHK